MSLYGNNHKRNHFLNNLHLPNYELYKLGFGKVESTLRAHMHGEIPSMENQGHICLESYFFQLISLSICMNCGNGLNCVSNPEQIVMCHI